MIEKRPLSVDVLAGIFRTSSKDPLRIINREGISIEFKESYNHAGMAQYFKTIASFSNNVGGYIIFGVGDKPRRLLGLADKSLRQFETLNVEVFTKNLLDYFAPEIKWDHCTFEYKGMSFGVIYIYEIKNKPCICKKNYDDQNPKYSLKEGDIYYRYGGRSEKIRYTELNHIIEESRKTEERKWLDFAKRAARIGIENACLLDLGNGVITGQSGTVVIDENLLSQLTFIKEGEFVEVKGKPTLRLVGDILSIESGKLVVGKNTRKVIRAIETDNIVDAFLNQRIVDEPLEYIKAIIYASSANFPVYFLLSQSSITIEDALRVVKETTSRGNTKKQLIKRLEGKCIEHKPITESQTHATERKKEYRRQWLLEKISVKNDEWKYCLMAVLSLDKKEVEKHFKYISSTLLKIYKNMYETADSILAQNIRNAICYIDEVVYLKK